MSAEIMFKGVKKGDGKNMYSPSVYSTEDGRIFLATLLTEAIATGNEHEISKLESVHGDALFVEIEPDSFEVVL